MLETNIDIGKKFFVMFGFFKIILLYLITLSNNE